MKGGRVTPPPTKPRRNRFGFLYWLTNAEYVESLENVVLAMGEVQVHVQNANLHSSETSSSLELILDSMSQTQGKNHQVEQELTSLNDNLEQINNASRGILQLMAELQELTKGLR